MSFVPSSSLPPAGCSLCPSLASPNFGTGLLPPQSYSTDGTRERAAPFADRTTAENATMLKLPSGSGCDTSTCGTNETYQQNAQFVANSYHNLPVAVPVGASSAGMPRQSLSTNGGSRKKTIHQFSFRSLIGNEVIRLSDFAGKMVLIVNVASHCNSTTKGYLQLNELKQQYPDLVILGCPCNQFGHQENLVGEEILMSLRHIRPGNGYVPNFRLTEKLEVNGANAHAVFNFLKLSLPYPSDRTLMDEMSAPGGVFSHPMRIIWMPVSRADLSWNFEKFLIGPDGVPLRRYSPKADCKLIAEDLRALSAGTYTGGTGL